MLRSLDTEEKRYINTMSRLLFFLFLFTSIVAGSEFNRTACAELAAQVALSDSAPPSFLTTMSGTLTSNISEAKGITYKWCCQNCGTGSARFNFILFATSTSSWLVPWLVLASQLPFETKDLWGNFMAFFLAIGSPMLITHSLAITVLNARWINDEFCNLKKWNKELGGQMVGVLNDVGQFLVASQGVPIQLVLGPEKELAQLIVDPRKKKWWRHLIEEMDKTKREW